MQFSSSRSSIGRTQFNGLFKEAVKILSGKPDVTEDSRGGVSPARLRKHQIEGGFPEPLFELFRRDTITARNVAYRLVRAHFPESMQSAVLEATLGERIVFDPWVHQPETAIGPSELLKSTVSRRSRNSDFRNRVLPIYGYQCAVCEFSIEFPLRNWPALEAAHIKWHSHHGPEIRQMDCLSVCCITNCLIGEPSRFCLSLFKSLSHLN